MTPLTASLIGLVLVIALAGALAKFGMWWMRAWPLRAALLLPPIACFVLSAAAMFFCPTEWVELMDGRGRNVLPWTVYFYIPAIFIFCGVIGILAVRATAVRRKWTAIERLTMFLFYIPGMVIVLALMEIYITAYSYTHHHVYQVAVSSRERAA